MIRSRSRSHQAEDKQLGRDRGWIDLGESHRFHLTLNDIIPETHFEEENRHIQQALVPESSYFEHALRQI